MKNLILLTITLIAISKKAQAIEMLIYKTPKKATKIEISFLDGVKVNDDCLKNKKECLLIMNKSVKPVIQSHKLSIGNPASEFCHAAGGASAILEDQKHNEYDFCLFEKKYYVDSWDFYKKYKK
jgi:putative hemolysin